MSDREMQLVMKIPGLISMEEAEYLRHEALTKVSVLEIGTHMGRSAAAMLLGLTDNMCCEMRLVTIDQDQARTDAAEKNIRRLMACAGLYYGEVELSMLSGFSFDIMPDMPSNHYDFIFLDGSHTAEHLCVEMVEARRLLRCGGTLAMHDYKHPQYPAVEAQWNAAKEWLDCEERCGSIVAGVKG